MTQIRFNGCDLSPRGTRTPRFGQRIGVALLACLLLVGGCGGDGRMSKHDYELRINDAGLQLSAVFGAIDQGTTNLHQLQTRVLRARKTLARVAATLADVKPPKDAEVPHRELTDALKSLSLDLADLATAAGSGNEKAVARARAELAVPARQIVAAIQQLQQLGYAINRG